MTQLVMLCVTKYALPSRADTRTVFLRVTQLVLVYNDMGSNCFSFKNHKTNINHSDIVKNMYKIKQRIAKKKNNKKNKKKTQTNKKKPTKNKQTKIGLFEIIGFGFVLST